MGAVSAVANTIVVPAHAFAQRRLRWPAKRWVLVASCAQLFSATLAALAWSVSVGGASLALYAVVFVSSLVGNVQQLALLPWLAEIGESDRIAEALVGSGQRPMTVSVFALVVF